MKLSLTIISFCLSLLLLGISEVRAAPSCSKLLSSLSKSLIPEHNSRRITPIPDHAVGIRDFSRLHSSVQPKNSIGFNLREIVPNENRVVIGIEKRKHIFMVVGNIRFDGRIFHDAEPKVFDSEIPVGQGMFLILSNVPTMLVNQLKQVILAPSSEAYFGCGHAVFSKLKEVGITPSLTKGLTVETSRIYEILTNEDFLLPDGKHIQTRLYRTQDVEPEQLYRHLTRYDEKVLSDIGRKFRGLSPDILVETITGHPREISEDLRLYLSELTGGS